MHATRVMRSGREGWPGLQLVDKRAGLSMRERNASVRVASPNNAVVGIFAEVGDPGFSRPNTSFAYVQNGRALGSRSLPFISGFS